MGVDVSGATQVLLQTPERDGFQSLLFSKIVPNCRKLWPPRRRPRLAPQRFTSSASPVRALGIHRRGTRRPHSRIKAGHGGQTFVSGRRSRVC